MMLGRGQGGALFTLPLAFFEGELFQPVFNDTLGQIRRHLTANSYRQRIGLAKDVPPVICFRYSRARGNALSHYGVNLIDDKFHALMVPENSKFQKDPRVAATRRFVAKLYNYKAYRTLAEDPGRYLITKDGKDCKAFKTPTLREIDKTAPYMHNGIFKTLDDVITFFDRGGGQSNTILKPIELTAENL